MIKKLILLIATCIIIYANDVKVLIKNSTINNAQTALIFLEAKNIKDAKLTLKNKHTLNLNFYKNKFKKDSYYALVPIDYRSKLKDYKVIISYIINNERKFNSVKIKVIDGKYKSEIIKVSKAKLKPNKKRVKRTNNEYLEAMKIYRSKSSKILWDNSFIYPIDSKITSPFGTKRIYNGSLKSFHSGTDFRAKIGTPILASNSGIVKIAKNRFYSGNSIVIDHGQGVYSCYFHLSKMNYKVGDFIKKGSILGLSGNTGRITGPHLHFSFRINSVQVDPLQAIKILNILKEY